jgi:hypothetical protein
MFAVTLAPYAGLNRNIAITFKKLRARELRSRPGVRGLALAAHRANQFQHRCTLGPGDKHRR